MVDDKVLKKLVEHDGRFKKIDGTLDSFNKKFKSVDGKLSSIDKRFEQVDKRFDRVENVLLKHDIKSNQMQDNMDRQFAELRDQMATSTDQILTIVQRLDQERVFTFAKVQELELNVQNQSKEINKIKKVLKIV